MKRILVVDDHASNRTLLRVLLQGHGFAVELAQHGAEALARARQCPPDAVVSDLLMPVMDGYTLLRHWKAEARLAAAPFIVYTATYTDPKDEAVARQLGADAFIVKPAEPDAFIAELTRVLGTAAGAAASAHPAPADAQLPEALEAYNAALVRRLEHKCQELERRVAEREAALAALADSQEQLRTLFEHSRDMIFLSHPDGRVLAANPAACEALGMTSAEVCGRGRAGLMDPQDPRLAAALDQRAAQGWARAELTMIRGDGSRMPVEMTSTVFRDSSGQWRASVIARDITERLQAEAERARLERQLRQAQKMEAVGALASGIAHDFNNVLGAMLGYAALAEQDAARGQPVQPHLAQIKAAGQRARTLVERILNFSRQQPTAPVALALQPLVHETIGMLRGMLPAGVQLDLWLPEQPVGVVVDATQIQQALMNLATNAWHAMPGGIGRIELGLAPVTLPRDLPAAPPLPPGPYAHLWLRDDGRGMDDATLARIFDPFFTTKPAGQGTGLGLATVYRIVQTHHGAITVDSQPGQGSTFHLLLPRVDGARVAAGTGAAATALSAADGQDRHVLYIDDDETMTLLAARIMARAGYRVSTFNDAEQAIAAVRAEPEVFDAVLTDYNMPRLNGADVARALAAIAPALPVLVISGQPGSELEHAIEGAGIRAMLRKERLADELVPGLARVLAT